MEIKVRSLDGIEPKSMQEVEQELLAKHEREINGEVQNEVVLDTSSIDNAAQQSQPEEEDLSEEKVLSYIGKRYNKQINSFDELMEQRQSNEELPEDVAAYLKYKKETGRGFDDFLNLRKDYDAMDPDKLLREYLADTQQNLDSEDIDVLMEEYTFDEDLDEESKIKRTKIARKKGYCGSEELLQFSERRNINYHLSQVDQAYPNKRRS